MNFLYSNNSNERSDFFKGAFETYAKDQDMFIAVPFFTDNTAIKQAIANGCSVKLIVRLCLITSAPKLQEIINCEKVSIRYYTDQSFHPKLYIFGSRIAFVGSSNMTSPGFQSNQELNIAVQSTDPISREENPVFVELQTIFENYWNNAEALTREVLNKFCDIDKETDYAADKAIKNYENQIEEKLGKVYFPNVTPKEKQSKESIFASSFLKKYQLFGSEFIKLRNLYESVGKRKFTDVPVNLEIDQFLNWIRETKSKTIEEDETPSPEAQKEFTKRYVKMYIEDASDKYCNIQTIKESFSKLNLQFKCSEAIDRMDMKQIYSCLNCLHAFSRRDRYTGGNFYNTTDENEIKTLLKYLLFAKDEDFVKRMAKCVYGKLKIANFGESCVKELYGWLNIVKTPICNGRALESMRWLGFSQEM